MLEVYFSPFPITPINKQINFNKVYFPNTLKACSLACGRVLSGKRLVLSDQEPEPRDRSGRFLEIRSWSAGVITAIAATGGRPPWPQKTGRPTDSLRYTCILHSKTVFPSLLEYLYPQGLMGGHTGASRNCGSQSFPS